MAVPYTEGISAQRAALRNPRDDGSLVGAIRTGNLDRLRTHIEQDSRAALREDPDFGMLPISWAFATGRLDMVELLMAAGANPLRQLNSGFGQPYTSALLWGHREAAIWLIDRVPRWEVLRDGEDVLNATTYGFGPDVAMRIVGRFAALDSSALPALTIAGLRTANPPRHPPFWRDLLRHSLWRTACDAEVERCQLVAEILMSRGSSDELRLFLSDGWTPPPAIISRLIARASRRLEADTVALLASYPFDRAELERMDFEAAQPPRIIWAPPSDEPRIYAGGADTLVRTDTPENRRAVAEEALERQRKAAATAAALRRLGLSVSQDNR